LSEKPIENEEITKAPRAKRKRAKPKRPTTASAQPVAPAHPTWFAAFLDGQSLRQISRRFEVPRSRVEAMARREGWRRRREGVREAAAARAEDRVKRKLTAIESAGLDARLLVLNRAKRSLRRRKLPGQEARALADVGSAIKSTDLHSEKARAQGPAVQVGLQFNLVDALRESRKYDLVRDPEP
jgi:hypothetical protein